MLEHSIEATAATLDGCERRSYRSLIEPLASEFAKLSEDFLGRFGTCRATLFYLCASVCRRFYLHQLWLAIISLENAPKPFLQAWQPIPSFH
jgi:hypothetical protein